MSRLWGSMSNTPAPAPPTAAEATPAASASASASASGGGGGASAPPPLLMTDVVRNRLAVLRDHIQDGVASVSAATQDTLRAVRSLKGASTGPVLQRELAIHEPWSPEVLTMLRLAMGIAASVPILSTAWLYTFGKPLRTTWLRSLGNMCGLLGIQGMASQIVMGSKVPVPEGIVGFDKIMALHTQVSHVLVASACLHACQKAFRRGGKLFDWQYLVSTKGSLALNLGRLALFSMITLVPLAYFQRNFARQGWVPRSIWKPAHYVLYLSVAGAFYHSYKLGLRRRSVFLLWLASAAAAAISGAYRGAYLAMRPFTSVFEVREIVRRTYDTMSVVMAPKGGAKLPLPLRHRKAGQFVIIRKRESSLTGWSEPHPFTLSGLPYDESVECTIKAMPQGRFSTTVSQWRAGDEIMVEGPYGVFTSDLTPSGNVVMIAGGVGVTPFICWLRTAYHKFKATGRSPRMTLVWGIKDMRDLMFFDEIVTWVTEVPEITVSVVLSDKNALATLKASPTWQLIPARMQALCFQGFVTEKILQEVVDPYLASWNLCGPPIMLRLVKRILQKAFGVPSVSIHYELFSW